MSTRGQASKQAEDTSFLFALESFGGLLRITQGRVVVDTRAERQATTSTRSDLEESRLARSYGTRSLLLLSNLPICYHKLYDTPKSLPDSNSP
jgi:hypothetical protein